MSKEGRIATNLRTLLILEIVGRADTALSPTEINAHIGLPKQSIHRLCATLVDEGFLVLEPGSKRLRPARRLRLMASGLLHASRIHIARRQILERVANEVRETVNFVVPEDDGMSYIDRVETDWPFRVQLPIGTRVPFHCTASGKTFLASLPSKARNKLLTTLVLDRRTPNTLTDPKLLAKELKTIAKQGYALDREEFMEGMVAIAVPVIDTQGRFVAALAFHGPTIRLSIDNLIARKGVLIDAAKQLTHALIED
ncbi:MAG: IclR family transcriptional regulator [Hyphomicrobiales bacterium]